MSIPIAIQKSVLIRKTARYILNLFGWQTNVILPPTNRYIFIGAPHTSNWDFAIFMLLITAEKLPVHWMGKDSLFKGPFGFIMRGLGGISVNRSKQTKFVDQAAAKFNNENELIIAISPEGTRSRTSRWRTGFYYIALKAHVPIVMAYIDYKKKICGLGPSVNPTGDIKSDFEIIRNFYKDFAGKHPNKQGEIRLT
jgi:1-acyl-sn-glycerol-3-phosphate acyltransferase